MESNRPDEAPHRRSATNTMSATAAAKWVLGEAVVVEAGQRALQSLLPRVGEVKLPPANPDIDQLMSTNPAALRPAIDPTCAGRELPAGELQG